jgi:3-oxoacyl-[acyl-carrier-protein] synthase-1
MATWVAGRSAITCVGWGPESLWSAALTGRTGIDGGLGRVSTATLAEARKDLQTGDATDRPLELTVLALRQALQNAGWSELTPRDGLILATTTGQIPLWDNALIEFQHQRMGQAEFECAIAHQPLGDQLARLSQVIGFKGKSLLTTSACAASTQALAVAAMWLELGWVDRCVVGGVEVLCDLTVSGFGSLQLLSPQPCRPFDVARAGINLSEGAAFICLEKQQRSAGQVRLSGYGMTSDGYHMTAPHPEGRGCYQAMIQALKTAGLESSDIDWIHAHGTGSIHNDLAEAAALRALFPTDMPWVSSSKWLHGHALGASGVIESVLCIEALERQMVLKTHGLEQPDPLLKLRYPIENLQTPVRHILKNTLGFGGTNAALVWSQA